METDRTLHPSMKDPEKPHASLKPAAGSAWQGYSTRGMGYEACWWGTQWLCRQSGLFQQSQQPGQPRAQGSSRNSEAPHCTAVEQKSSQQSLSMRFCAPPRASQCRKHLKHNSGAERAKTCIPSRSSVLAYVHTAWNHVYEEYN